MNNSNGLTSNVSSNNINNPTQPNACRVRTSRPGVPIVFEPGSIKTQRSEDVNIATKRRKFKAWKAGAKKFSWDLFAVPEDLIDSLKGGQKRTAANLFRTYASGVIEENGWEKLHGMTLWTLLPEKYKSEWKATAELGGAQETSEAVPSCVEVPNFKEVDHFQNSTCAYFTFQATPELSASPVVDTSNNNVPGTSRNAFAASQHGSCDTPDGAIFPAKELIYIEDDNSRPIPDPLDYLLDFDNGLMPIEQPISSGLNLPKSPFTYFPNFDFGLISDFGVENLIPSRESNLPPIPEDLTLMLDEQRPAKWRRINPKEDTGFNHYFPTQNPRRWAPSNGLDNFFGTQVPPFPSITPKVQDLMTQRHFDPDSVNLPTIGRDSMQKLCNHQGAASSVRTPAEATESSASLLSYASTSTGIRGQECGDQYDIGASIFWQYLDMPPSNFTSVLGSGQSNGDIALDPGTIADMLSTLTHPPTAEYLVDSLLETQDGSNYEFPGEFGF